jgi:hypothetical protein
MIRLHRERLFSLAAVAMLLAGAITAVRAGGKGPDFDMPAHAAYQKECGACHLAYPPGLLPARSWGKLLGGLSDHFGDDAELDAATLTSIHQHLAAHAADRGGSRRAPKILNMLPPDDTPLRFTATRYFQRKHQDIPARLAKDNPQVGSFARCETCHREAAQGWFDDDRGLHIPGDGRRN